MQDDKKSPAEQNQKSVANARRSFIKKASIGAPIVIASSAKPAWGAGICALSGSLSGNLSNHGNSFACNSPMGRSPGYWAKWEKILSCKERKYAKGLNRIYNWSVSGVTPLRSFSAEFGWTPLAAISDSLGAVLTLGPGTDPFERHVVAAFLSSKHPSMAGSVPYTTQQVGDAYNIVRSNPGSQQALDIIDIFNALFESHDETALLSTPSDFELPGLLSEYSGILGLPTPAACS